jgi:hypothetical protein
MAANAKQVVRILVMKQGDHFVALCVDYDLAVQASSPEELPGLFESALRMTYRSYAKEGKNMFEVNPQRSEEFADLFVKSSFPAVFPETIPLDDRNVWPEARMLLAS